LATKWLVALMTAFIVLSLLSGIIEQEYLGNSTAGLLSQVITRPEVTEVNNPLTFVATFVTQIWQILKVVWQAFTWDYAFFDGYWAIVRYAIFMPISVGMIVSLLMALRGVSSA